MTIMTTIIIIIVVVSSSSSSSSSSGSIIISVRRCRCYGNIAGGGRRRPAIVLRAGLARSWSPALGLRVIATERPILLGRTTRRCLSAATISITTIATATISSNNKGEGRGGGGIFTRQLGHGRPPLPISSLSLISAVQMMMTWTWTMAVTLTSNLSRSAPGARRYTFLLDDAHFAHAWCCFCCGCLVSGHDHFSRSLWGGGD